MNPTDPQTVDAQRAIALLQWYRDAGIDVFLQEAPRDRFIETQAEQAARGGARRVLTSRPGGGTRGNDEAPERAREPQALPSAPSRDAAPDQRSAAQAEPVSFDDGGAFPASRIAVPDEIAVADARERARSAQTLEELRAALASFEGCNLRVTAKSLVFGEGNPRADIMFVGEAPGREEDIAGVPFVGKSGQLLNRMLASIGVERDTVRVTNTVPWRPPGNRPPTPVETQMCLPFVERQIELVRPKLLICLGSPATKAILKSDEGILRARGRWTTYAFGLGESEAIPAMAMLHPAYLLRQPAQKRLAWRDLLSLKARLAEVTGHSRAELSE